MRKTTILMLAAVLILGLLAGATLYAREAPEEEKGKIEDDRLAKASSEPLYTLLNINNVWHWLEVDGESGHSRNGDNGTYFPRGMVWVIYHDGIKWAGRCYTDEAMTTPAPYGQRVRIGGCDYGNGTREGWVDGFGASAVRADPADPDNRMWRIRRDFYTAYKDEDGDWTDEALRDAAEYYEKAVADVSESEVQFVWDQYITDWNNWPVQYGAPYIDRDGDGVYTAPPPFSATFTVDDLITGVYDEPGIAGADVNSPADQVVWNAYNDLDRTRTLAMEGSEPIGLEVQRSVWGYNRTDALGNIYFMNTLIINKGGVDVDGAGTRGSFYIDSMYVAEWSDPDLGAHSDDLLGCDVPLSMGYVYNGNATDNQFVRYGQVVPAAGYDFLAGPIIPAGGDTTAVFNLKYRPGFKNLGMSSFSWFSAGSAITDPPSDYIGGLRWDKMLRGWAPIDGPDVYYPFPPGVEPNSFPLSGDPVTGTGLVDGQGQLYSFAPGDRRLNMSSGPFTLAPGDTQQCVVAFVAGQGSDRLSSVAVMKFNDRAAQNTFDNLFQVPKPPAAPNVSFTALDEEIVLSWGDNLQSVQTIEETVAQPGNYTFEGYNVYQLPRSTSGLAEARRIATFDLETAPTLVFDDLFDQNSGQILFMPAQYGSNSGIQRWFRITRDYIRDVDRIYNGEEYYFAVTSYTVAQDEDAIPKSLESQVQVLTIQPHKPVTGLRYGADAMEVIADDYITHPSGIATGTVVEPVIVSPDKVVDATYTFNFNSDTLWKEVLGVQQYYFSYDFAKNGTVIESELENFELDENYPIVDGILWKIRALFSGPLDYQTITSTGGGTYDIDSYGVNGWAGSGRASDVDSWGAGTADVSLLIGDIELRFTGEYDTDGVSIKDGTGSIATVVGARNYTLDLHPLNPVPGSTDRFTVRIPFEVWDIERGLQINCIIYDRIQLPEDDPFYAFNPAARMYVWLNSLPYQETVLTEEDDEELTWNLVFWETDWQTGDVVTIVYGNNDNLVGPDDTYQVTTGEYLQSQDTETAKLDVERITVYPNPYYAFNPAELNRLARFVTFTNLPPKATIRIFNLAGQLVRTIEKDNTSTFQRWDLLNHDGLPVASGMYIAYVEATLPTDGSTAEKILKFGIIQEQEVLDVY